MGGVTELIERFPGLASLPRCRFLEGPTPVSVLKLEGVPDGDLYVKRDERCSAIYGGNKPRKLEFVIGEARARGARRLITAGGYGTHHGLATALFARESAIATTLLLVPQPLTAHVQQQLRRMLAAGAELVLAGGVAEAALRGAAVLARSWERGERPRWIPVGGSSPAGAIGFVAAAFELAAQVREGALPEPAEIYVPVGSGGTLAGLALGLRLAGLASRAVGVLVTDLLPPTPRRVARLAARTLARMRRADPGVPALRLAPDDFAIERRQVGPGYGAPTPAARAALAAAREAGLRLELTYSAKCLAEIRERFRSGRARPPVLFWNTFDAVTQASDPPECPPPSRWPRGLARLLESQPIELA